MTKLAASDEVTVRGRTFQSSSRLQQVVFVEPVLTVRTPQAALADQMWTVEAPQIAVSKLSVRGGVKHIWLAVRHRVLVRRE